MGIGPNPQFIFVYYKFEKVFFFQLKKINLNLINLLNNNHF